MNLGRYRFPQVERNFKNFVNGLKLSERMKIVNDFLDKRKEKKVKREKELESRERESIIGTIYEIFGLTAIMSVTVLTIMGVLIMSFVMTDFLTYFRDLGWLSLGLAGVMLGVGWYKPYKVWSLIVTIVGAFLLVITFGPLVIEAYSGRNLIDVNFRNGYWMTLKSTMVFVSYLTCGTAFITWMYLLSKGRRKNPLRKFRSASTITKQRVSQLVVRIKSI
jgi:hypothetical protein